MAVMTKSKMVSYMRNVGRSFGYALTDNFASMNPTVTALFKQTAEQTKDLYQSVKNFDAKSLGFESEDLKGSFAQALKDFKNNAIEDAMTGKWYNKQRIQQYKNDMAKDMFGIDFDDFGDFDDFNFDDEDSDLRDQAAIQEDATKATVQAMDRVGEKTSTAISTATVKSADYIVESGRANTKALYNLNMSGFGQINKGMTSINSNLQLLVKLAEPLNTHINNSAMFYTKSTEYQNKSLELLEKIAANTAPKSPNQNRPTSKKRYTDYVTSEGVLDFKSLIEDGAKRLKENTELYTSMLSMFPGGEKALLKMATASPFQFALTTLMGGMFNMKDKNGNTIRSSFENFNKVLSNFSLGLMGKLKNAKFGDNIFSPFLRGIRDFLLPNNGVLKRPDPSKYVKGKVDWDGMSRKALMDVIPTQLSQILSALTGEPERRFDYNSGRWIKVSNIAANMRKENRRITNSAGGDLFRTVGKSVDNMKGWSASEKKQYKEEVEMFLMKAVMSGDDDFLNFLSKNFDFTKYGMSPNVGRDLQKRIRAISNTPEGNRMLSGFAGNVYTSRNNIDRKYRNMSADGVEMALYNNSKRQFSGKPSLITDEYGQSQFDYLRNILSNVSYIAKNLKNLVGIEGVGGVNESTISWVEGDLPTKANPHSKGPGASTDRIERKLQTQSNRDAIRRSGYQSDLEDSITSVMGDKGDKPNYTAAQKEYLKKKATAQARGKEFKIDQEMEDAIARADKIFEMSQKVKGGIGGIYGKFRNNDGFIGKSLEKFEKAIDVTTDSVSTSLNEMSSALNEFIYNKDFGLMALLKGLTLGITDLIPKPVREAIGWGFDKFRKSDFWKQTKNTLADIITGSGKKKEEKSKSSNMTMKDFYTDDLSEYYLDEEYQENFMPGPHARGARRVSKTGIVSVSEGEMIIPSEWNPFYHGITNKSQQIKNEQNAIARFWGKYARGGMAGYGKRRYGKVRTAAMGSGTQGTASTREAETAGTSTQDDGTGDTEEIPPDQAKSTASKIINAAGKFLADKLFGAIAPHIKDANGNAKDKEEISSIVKKMMEEAGLGKGAIGAGAVIGGASSLITGAFIGPIAGAAIGAAVGFVSKSKTAQELLFGKEENGKRQGGLVPKDISNFIYEHAGSMGKGAGAGAAIGMFAGSPLIGAILGAGAGFIKSSDEAKAKLFGTDDKDGIFPKKMQEALKKMIPGLATGAGAALLFAPGPLIPRLIAGAAIGSIMGKNSDKLGKWFWGDEEKGNKGFVGYLKEKLIDPMLGTVDKFANMIWKGFKDSVFGIGKRLRSFLATTLRGTILGQGIYNVGSAIARAPGKLLKAGVNVVGAPFRGANALLERAALKNGTAFRGANGQYLTSGERINLANKNHLFDSGSQAMDRFINDAINNGQDLDQIQEALELMRDPAKMYDKDIISNNNDIWRYLHTQVSSGAMDRNLGHKLYKQISGGKDPDKILKLIENDTSISPADKMRIQAMAQAQNQNFANRRNALSNTKQQNRELLQSYSNNPALQWLLNNQLSDGDISHGLEQLKIDREAKDAAEAAKKGDPKVAVTERIPNLIEKVVHQLDRLIAVTQDKPDPGEGEDTNDNMNAPGEAGVETDQFGNDSQNLGSRSVQAANKRKNKIMEAMTAIPLLGPGIQKISDVATAIHDKLFGNKEEQKEGIFSKMFKTAKEFLFGDGAGKLGLLGGLLGFFTGKEVGSGIVGTLLNKFSLASLVKTGAGFVGLYALFKGFFGGYDDLPENSILRKILSAIPWLDQNTTNGGDSGEKDDANDHNAGGTSGDIYKRHGGDGTHTKGRYNYKDKRISLDAVDGSKISKRLQKNIVGGAILGRKSLLTAAVGVATRGKVKLTPGGVRKTLVDIAKNGANSGLINGIIDVLSKACETIAKVLPKVPFINVADDAAEEIGSKLFVKLGGALERIGNSTVLKNIAATASKALVVLQVAYLGARAIDAWGNAESILGITEKATFGQKTLAVLLDVTNAAIPFVGDLIQTKELVSFFIDIADKVGLDVGDIKEQRERAEAEVKEFNELYGDTLTVEQYNQMGWTKDENGNFVQGKARAGIFTKAKMRVGGMILDFKEKGGIKGLAGRVGDKVSDFTNAAGKAIGDAANKVKEGAVGIWEWFSTQLKDPMMDFVKGDKNIAEYFKIESPDENDPMSGVAKGAIMAARIISFPRLLVARVAGDIGEGAFKLAKGIVEKLHRQFEINQQEADLVEQMLFAEGGPDWKAIFTDVGKPDNMSEDNMFSGLFQATTVVRRLFKIPTAVIFHAGKSVAGWIKDKIMNIPDSFDKFKSAESELWSNVGEGDVGAIASGQLSDIMETKDLQGNPVGGFLGGIYNITRLISYPAALFVHDAKNIYEKVTALVDYVKDRVNLFKSEEEKLWGYVKDGDIKAIALDHANDIIGTNDINGNPVGGFLGGIYNTTRLVAYPVALLHNVGKAVGGWISGIIDGVKESADATARARETMKNYADLGQTENIGRVEPAFEEGSLLTGLFKGVSGIEKIFYMIIGGFNKMAGPIKETVGNFADGVGKFFGKLFKDFNEFMESGEQRDPNSQYQYSGSGSGMINQRSSDYAGISLGGKSFADNGCGPATASMVTGAPLNSSISVARKYQTSGGTDAGYFGEMFNRSGMSANYVTGSKMLGAVASGTPTVLMGRDPSNTSKANSPFGPNNHYVVANGIDSAGNVLIKDPESNYPRKYSSKILDNVSLGVAAGATGDYQNEYYHKQQAGIDRLISGDEESYQKAVSKPVNVGVASSVGSVADLKRQDYKDVAENKAKAAADAAKKSSTSTASFKGYTQGVTIPGVGYHSFENHTITGNNGYGYSTNGSSYFTNGNTNIAIWRYLTEVIGVNEFGAAGIMGCWQAESGNNPDRIEGDYLKSFPGKDEVLADSDTLDAYTLNVLFPAYQKSGINIKEGAYVGSDGHYYPGFGLAQWTGSRGYELHMFAESAGEDWRSLKCQLMFAEQEFNSKYSGVLAKLAEVASVEDATKIAYKEYEGCSRQDWLSERISYAIDIYNELSGKTYSGDIFGGITDGSYTGTNKGGKAGINNSKAGKLANKAKSGATIGGMLSVIQNAFSTAFGELFNGKNEASVDPTTGAVNGKQLSEENQQGLNAGSLATGKSAMVSGGANFSGNVANNFPYYNQADEPWGSQPYGKSGTVKSSGCGPTSMAMVLSSYNRNYDPGQTADWSVNNGYRVEGQGTSWDFFKAIGSENGLQVNQFGPDVESAKAALEAGIPVIGSMKPGDFTKGGHFIVFSGKENENVLVNDPGSRKRTNAVWNADSALGQAKQFWSITDENGEGSIGRWKDNGESTTDYSELSGAEKEETDTKIKNYVNQINEQKEDAGVFMNNRNNTFSSGFTSALSGQGSGLFYKGSKAGNRILNDNSRSYSAGDSGMSFGFESLSTILNNMGKDDTVPSTKYSNYRIKSSTGQKLINDFASQYAGEIDKLDNKEVQLILKAMISVIENLVVNTTDVGKIFELLEAYVKDQSEFKKDINEYIEFEKETTEQAQLTALSSARGSGIGTGRSSTIRRPGPSEVMLESLSNLRAMTESYLV